MQNLHDLPRVRLGVFPTPFYRLDRLSEQYGRGIWIKRDDLCGVALGGSKVRKLEFVLAEALDQGCDTVFTTGGAQSNHAALTAACAARLGMKCILLLKRRGVTEHRGNLVLDELFGAEVRLLDTDSYDEIYAEMHRIGGDAGAGGAQVLLYSRGRLHGPRRRGLRELAPEEIAVQAMAAGVRLGHIVSATGSGGTAAGLLLGAGLFLPGAKVTGIAVDSGPFDEIVPRLAGGGRSTAGVPLPAGRGRISDGGAHGPRLCPAEPGGHPLYRGAGPDGGHPAGPGLHREGLCRHDAAAAPGRASDGQDDLLFVHTGGAAALFAIDLPR